MYIHTFHNCPSMYLTIHQGLCIHLQITLQTVNDFATNLNEILFIKMNSHNKDNAVLLFLLITYTYTNTHVYTASDINHFSC